MTPDVTDDHGRKQGDWTDPDPHGGSMIGTYVDGLRQGVWRHVAADGRLRSEGGYADGELDGDWTWYRANGHLMQRGAFRRGRKHGTWERWNAAGEPLERGDYALDRKVGEWHALHPDGSIKRTTRHGPAPDSR